MARPKIPDRISKDAAKRYPLTNGNDLETGKRIGYIAGATAEAERSIEKDKIITQLNNAITNKDGELRELKERAQKLVEALELITALTAAYRQGATHSIFDLIDDIETNANNALQQYNATPDRPCPHCGKELNRDRNLYCRECGKEVEG